MGSLTLQKSGARSVRVLMSWGPSHTAGEIADFQRKVRKLAAQYKKKKPAAKKPAAKRTAARKRSGT